MQFTILIGCFIYDHINNHVQFEKGSKADKLICKSDEEKEQWTNLRGRYNIIAVNVVKYMWYPDYATV